MRTRGMLLRRYRLSPRARLLEGAPGRWLVCDHPLQALRLNETAWDILSRLDGEAWLHDLAEPAPPGLTDYLDDLAERGLLGAEFRTVLRAGPAARLPRVHVVVPAYLASRGSDALARCLAGIGALDYPAGRFTITVVDDGSPEPLAERTAQRLPDAELRWVRLERNAGPGAARNAGVAALRGAGEGDLLAFLDSDCVPAPQWLREAVAVLEDPALCAVGGAVAGLRRETWLERYEDACSSLHMGERPGRAGLPGAPVPYLPTCNLVLRLRPFRNLGGFRHRWRTGEDVDLSWRLAAAGERLFYWPAARVGHDHRARPAAFLARRLEYGRSEGHLARAWPERFARPIGSWAFLAGLVAGGVALQGPGSWAAAALALAVGLVLAPELMGAVRAWRRWPAAHRGRSRLLMLAALLRMWGARGLRECRLLLRQGLILLLPLAWILPRLSPLVAAVILCGLWGEWRARRSIGQSLPAPREFALGWLLECLAYSLGRIEGHLRVRLTGKRGANGPGLPGRTARKIGDAQGPLAPRDPNR